MILNYCKLKIIIIWLFYGVICVGLGVTKSSQASSIQKTIEGLVFGDQINCILSNVLHDQWIIKAGTYSNCTFDGITGSTNFEIELNKPIIADQIFRLTLNVTTDAFDIKTRYEVDGDFYKISLSTTGTANLYKCTPSCGSSLASGTVSPYSGEISVTVMTYTSGSDAIIRLYESDGTQVFTYTDTTSPLGSGTIRIATNSGKIMYFYQMSSNSVIVNGLGSYRALLCSKADALIASDTSGIIDITGILVPIDGYVTITTSGTSCTTNVDEKLRTFEIVGGDVYTYSSSQHMLLGPRVADVNSTTAKIWAKFSSDANGSTMKVQYKPQAGSWPDTTCTADCISAGTILSSSDDYTKVVELSGLSASTDYDCRVYIDSVLQGTSQCSFTTHVSSGDLTLKISFASCLCTIKRPYDLFDVLNNWGIDIFILEGDNIYEECPYIIDDVSTYTSGATRLNGYRLKYSDVFGERKYNDFMSQNSTIGTLDDHEVQNDYDGGTGTALYADSIEAYDEYIMSGNPSPLVSGTRYWKKTIGNIDILALDLISHRDPILDTDAKTENNYTCGRNGTNLDQVDCSGSPNLSGISTADGLLQFDGKWYDIIAVNDGADTITVHENISCTTCTSQTVRVIETYKAMMGSLQFAEMSQVIKASTADVIIIITSKAVFAGTNSDDWGEYTTERDLWRTYIGDTLNLNGSGNCNRRVIWLSGDNHLSYYSEPVMLGASSNCKENELAASPIGPSALAGLSYSANVVKTIANKLSVGIVTINTTPTTPTISFNVLDEDGNELLFGNNIIDYLAYSGALSPNNSVISAIDTDGTSFVAYITSSSAFTIVKSEDTLGTYSSIPTNYISKTGISTVTGISMTIDEINDKLYVIYEDTSSYDLMIQTASFSSGLSWDGNETKLFDGDVSDNYTPKHIIIDSNGYIEVLFQQVNGGYAYAITRRSTLPNSITSWETDLYHQGSAGSSEKYITGDIISNGELIIGILDSSNSTIYYNVRSGSGIKPIITDSNMVDSWYFEEGSAQTVAAQKNSPTLDGTLGCSGSTEDSDPTWSSEYFYTLYSLDFENSVSLTGCGVSSGYPDEWVEIPDNNVFDLTNAFTLEVLVKPESFPASGTINAFIAKGAASETSGLNHTFLLTLDNNVWSGGVGIVCLYENSSGTNYLTSYIHGWSAGTLHHVVCTFDNVNNRLTLYEDGTQKSQNISASGDPDINAQKITIGKASDNHATYSWSSFDTGYDGKIFYVALYNNEKTANQIKDMYWNRVGWENRENNLPTITTSAQISNRFAPTITGGINNAGIVYKSNTFPYPLQFTLWDGTSWNTPYSLNANEEGISPALGHVSNKWYAAYLTENIIRIYQSSNNTPTSISDWSSSIIDTKDSVAKNRLKISRDGNTSRLHLLYDRNLAGINEIDRDQVSIISYMLDIDSLTIVPLWHQIIGDLW